MTCQHHERTQTAGRAKAGAVLPTVLGDPFVLLLPRYSAATNSSTVPACVCVCVYLKGVKTSHDESLAGKSQQLHRVTFTSPVILFCCCKINSRGSCDTRHFTWIRVKKWRDTRVKIYIFVWKNDERTSTQ